MKLPGLHPVESVSSCCKTLLNKDVHRLCLVLSESGDDSLLPTDFSSGNLLRSMIQGEEDMGTGVDVETVEGRLRMQKVHCLSWPGNVISSSSRTTLEQPSQLHHIVSTTSNLHFSARNNPWLNHHSKPVLLGWRANVDLQPILGPPSSVPTPRSSTPVNTPASPKLFSADTTLPWTTFCPGIPQDLPVEKRRPALLRQVGRRQGHLRPHKRPFTLRPSPRRTFSGITTRLTTMTLPSRLQGFLPPSTPGHSGEFECRDGVIFALALHCALLQQI